MYTLKINCLKRLSFYDDLEWSAVLTNHTRIYSVMYEVSLNYLELRLSQSENPKEDTEERNLRKQGTSFNKISWDFFEGDFKKERFDCGSNDEQWIRLTTELATDQIPSVGLCFPNFSHFQKHVLIFFTSTFNCSIF